MKIRIGLMAILAMLVSACTNQATGQKGAVELKTSADSVSYGLGTDIGNNLRRGGFDSLNIEAMSAGIRDGYDSTERITSENIRLLVQRYMLAAQSKMMEKERKAVENKIKDQEAWFAENGKRQGVVTTSSGLQYEVVTNGNGPKPTLNDVVKVHFRGMLMDGTEFANSYKGGAPAERETTGWIPGFVEALQLMPKGSKWKIYIPQHLAYGAQSPEPSAIPAYSALIFDLELIDITVPGGTR